MVTLKDIANEVGVSVSTVSRTINGGQSKKPSKKTEEAIWEAVARLGYKPNSNARNLVSGIVEEKEVETYSIAIILVSPYATFSTIFFRDMLSLVIDEMQNTNLQVKYVLSSKGCTTAEFYQKITSVPVDGAIILGVYDEEMFKILQDNIKYLVYTGMNPVEQCADEVICDGYKSAELALMHLIEEGYKKIGYIGPIHRKKDRKSNRFIDYKNILQKRNIALEESCVKESTFEAASGYEAMKAMGDCIPEAIYCTGDMIAVGAMKYALEQGLRIPEDVAFIGMANRSFSGYMNPSLTTIDVPKESLSKISVSMLVDKIENKHRDNIRVDVTSTLHIRESSKKYFE
ncbi:MAG: LacI family DNA-binding transcriptional regulator [Eubacteriales bacterium]